MNKLFPKVAVVVAAMMLVGLLVTARGAQAQSITVYHVDGATGVDAPCSASREDNPGQPFASIQGAFDCLKFVQTGDITGSGLFRIEVSDSATYLEEISLTGLTTSVNDTLIVAAALGTAPTIDGEGTRGSGFDVRIDNVIIDGFRLTNFAGTYGNGVQIDGNDNLEVRNNTIDAQSDFAILIGFRHTGSVDLPSHNVWIHNNILLNAVHEGSDSANQGDGIHIMGGADGTRVENNVFYGFQSDAIFFMSETGGEEALNTMIKNNIFYPTYAGSNGITLQDLESQPGTSSNYNLCYLTGNPVSAKAGFWDGVDQTSLTDWQAASGLDTDTVDQVPLFQTPGTDFHVQSKNGRWNPGTSSFVTDGQDSPAIDKGDPSSEFSNETSPNGGRINVGAYGNTFQASLSAIPAAQVPGLTAWGLIAFAVLIALAFIWRTGRSPKHFGLQRV